MTWVRSSCTTGGRSSRTGSSCRVVADSAATGAVSTRWLSCSFSRRSVAALLAQPAVATHATHQQAQPDDREDGGDHARDEDDTERDVGDRHTPQVYRQRVGVTGDDGGGEHAGGGEQDEPQDRHVDQLPSECGRVPPASVLQAYPARTNRQAPGRSRTDWSVGPECRLQRVEPARARRRAAGPLRPCRAARCRCRTWATGRRMGSRPRTRRRRPPRGWTRSHPLGGVVAAGGEAGAARLAVVDEDGHPPGVGVQRGRDAADVPPVAGGEERQQADRGVLGGVRRPRHVGRREAGSGQARRRTACTRPPGSAARRAGRSSGVSSSTSPVRWRRRR